VEWLEASYPDRFPDRTLPHLEIVARSAQVEVVRMIRSVYESQKEAGLYVGAALQGHGVGG